MKNLYLLLIPIAAILGLNLMAADRYSSETKTDYIFLEAQDAFDDGRIDDYYFLMRRAAALAPSDTFIAGRLAEVSLLMPTSDSAVVVEAYNALKNRFLANPTNDIYSKTFVRIATRMGNVEDVIEVWSMLDSLQPQRSEPAVNLAETLMGKFARTADTASAVKAIELFNRLESRLGPTVPVTSRKVSTYLMMRDTASVLSEIDRLIAAAPADVDARLLSGAVFQQLGMPDKALEFYNEAQNIDPENGQVYISKAEFFREQGDSVAYDREVFKALESQELEFGEKFELLTGYVTKLYTDTLQWNRIGEMFAVLQDINPGEADLHDFYASYFEAIGKREQAAEQLSYSISLDPTNIAGRGRLASLYIGLNDTTAAINTAAEARAMYPDEPIFYYLECVGLMMRGDDEEALKVLEGADTLTFPNRNLESDIFATRGDILSRLGRNDEAQTDYKRAVDANPENYMAMNNWAYFNAEEGTNLESAELYASIAAAALPENPTVTDTFAWVLFKNKDYARAKEEIDNTLRLLGLLPGQEGDNTSGKEVSVEIFDHAGDIYFWNQLPKEAVEFWKKALELDPNNALIKKKVHDGTYYFE